MASRRRSCILVEGSPGYGKTTLARKIAADWGEKAGFHYLQASIYTKSDTTLEKGANCTGLSRGVRRILRLKGLGFGI